MADGVRKPLSTPYAISVLIILLCGGVSAVLMYRDASRDEAEHTEADFSRRANVRHALTREMLGGYTDAIFGLSAIFAVDPAITRLEFAQATAHLQKRLNGATAIEWIPYVTHEKRAAFESDMSRLYPERGFQILDFDEFRRPRRAADRPSYYPIGFVEPLRGNEIVLGYDVSQAPTRAYLLRARETRQTVLTNQFQLIQDTENKAALIIICPVFRPVPGEPASAAVSTEVFAGFFQCIFMVEQFLESICGAQADPVLDMLFIDVSEPDPSKRIIYFRPASDGAPRTPLPTEAEFKNSAPFTREMGVILGQREWRVIYRPRDGWVDSMRSWSSALRAGAVLLLTGMLAGLVTVIGRRTDTIRLQVEQRTAELAESRRQFANLLHALPGMAYRATGEDGLDVVFASEGALQLTGWSAADFISGAVHLRDLMRSDELERVRAQTRAALRSKKDIEVEFRIRTRDGDEKHVLSRARGVYEPDGTLRETEALVIDITDSKRAEASRLAIERKLLETQKLESLGLLAGGIAHDFNNILSAVLGNASLARMTLENSSPADPQLRAIETAALRAAELCRQMLAYAGKGRFVVERVDVSALIEDLLPLLRVSIARTAVLHLDIRRDLPGVKADATQVRQIVMNLVLNAVDALGGKDGEIGIRTGVENVDKALLARCVSGAGLPTGEYVFLEVSDTGCGMPPEMIGKIFDPFFTTKVVGRGLGLAAVLGIVRGHNGALLVESEVGKGSKFQLFLPPIAGETVRPEPAASEPPSEQWHHSGDVLVIEDEEPVRVVLVELLKAVGFNAHAVPDGKAGVQLFRENASRWTLVVIDLLMPGMSGEATLGALRAISSDVRVLLISGYTQGDLMNRISNDGRVAFLGKPFRQDVFEQTLRDLLR